MAFSLEQVNFEAYERMLLTEQGESSLLKMGDFLAQPGGFGVDEGRYQGTESEREEKEDVWKLFCLIEDYRKAERGLVGSNKKKKLKEEEVKEMREDREKYCLLKKKLEEEDYRRLREGRFLKEVRESFPFKLKECGKRVLWEKKKIIEMLLVCYIDEKRAESLKSEWVKIRNFFSKCEELKKEIEEKRESFEVKKSKEEKKKEKKAKENEKEENVEKKGEESFSTEEKKEEQVSEDEGVIWEEGEIEEISGIGDEKGKEKNEGGSEKKSKEWIEVLDEEGKVVERKSKKIGKVKKGDWVRREYFVRLEDSEKNEQRWKCKVCEKVLEKKKVNLLEVHRHFLDSHGEIGKEIEIEKLPGDYDCRKLWLSFYEKSKIEMSEELEKFLKQERKRKQRKDGGDGGDERDLKKRKIEKKKEEESEIISVSSLPPLSNLLFSSFVKGRKLKTIQDKVQKVLKKVNIIFFHFFL